jgi:hypothetical protein
MPGPFDIPAVEYGVQSDYKKLYFSEPEAALKVQITLQAGYGVLPQGQALCKNLSAAGGKGKFLPYNPTTIGSSDKGRAYLVANSGTTDNYVYVSMNDSYKFAVGDDLIIDDNVTAAENKGAITAIDRTSESHRAKITFTTNIGGTAFTTARLACVFVEKGDSSNNYSDCVGILEKTVDTGTGSSAKGAVATMILSNALLYNGMLTEVDAAARTDISASVFGQYLLIK